MSLDFKYSKRSVPTNAFGVYFVISFSPSFGATFSWISAPFVSGRKNQFLGLLQGVERE